MIEKGNRSDIMFRIGQLHAMRNKKIKPYDNMEEIYADTFDAIAKEMELENTKDLLSIIEYGDAIDLGYINATISDMKRRIVQKAVMTKRKEDNMPFDLFKPKHDKFDEFTEEDG